MEKIPNPPTCQARASQVHPVQGSLPEGPAKEGQRKVGQRKLGRQRKVPKEGASLMACSQRKVQRKVPQRKVPKEGASLMACASWLVASWLVA